MDISIFTIFLISWAPLIWAGEGGANTNVDKFSVYSLFRHTINSKNVEEFLGIQYAEVTHDMKEAASKEINDSVSVDLQHRFYQSGPPFCQQARDDQTRYTSTDCLFLNIFTPKRSDKTLPVLVWLVGGLFKQGGINLPKYRASSLSSKINAVLVTVQYRIGASGFFYLNNEYAPGNNGLKDQILALKWINQYIDLFRGDKENIVLIGDEAGAASVGYHLLSPKTSKLFKSAAMINGVPNNEWAFMDKQQALNRSLSVKERYRCGDALDCFKDGVNEPEIRSDWLVVPEGEAIRIPFAPTEESTVVPDHPLVLLHRATHLAGKKIMIGNTKDAGMKFAMKRLEENGCDSTTSPPNCYHANFKKSLLPTLQNNVTTYHEFNAFSKNISTVPYYHNRLADIFTNRYFRCPAEEFVKAARGHGATVYQFEFQHSGGMHGDELKYFMFDMSDFKAYDWSILNKAGYQLSGFVKNGNPSSEIDKGWNDYEIFHMGAVDGKASDSRAYCKFLKENLPNYFPEIQSGQVSLRISIFELFIASVVAIVAVL